MFFSVIINILNWEILSKNFVTFKRRDEIKDRKFWYYRGSLKNPIFMGGQEEPKYRGKISLRRGGVLDSL